jgi:hypothetical protein
VWLIVLRAPTALSSVTDVALLKAQNLLSSAKNLLGEDRMTLGGEAA